MTAAVLTLQSLGVTWQEYGGSHSGVAASKQAGLTKKGWRLRTSQEGEKAELGELEAPK